MAHDPEPECSDTGAPSLEALLRGAQRGDARAVDTLVARYYRPVEVLVRRRLRVTLRQRRVLLMSRFSTGDIVQEVFRSLLGTLADMPGVDERSFVGLVSTIARNRIIDAIRFHEASSRDVRRSIGGGPDRDHSAPGDGPSAAMEREETFDRLARVLDQFPLREQLLLRGRLEEELTFQRLAELLGFTSPHAARRAFFAAQAKMALALKDL